MDEKADLMAFLYENMAFLDGKIMDIKDKIRILREMNHFTQEEMAEKLDISTSAYSKMERGISRLQLETLQKIANAFDLDISDLISAEKSIAVFGNENSVGNFYSGNESVLKELDSAKLAKTHLEEIILSKNELIQQKEREIEALKEIIALMKAQQ